MIGSAGVVIAWIAGGEKGKVRRAATGRGRRGVHMRQHTILIFQTTHDAYYCDTAPRAAGTVLVINLTEKHFGL